MKAIQLLVVVLVGIASFAIGGLWERGHAQAAPLESRIIREADVKKSTGTWGSIETYTAEGTPTVGTSSMLVAELEFLPGKQLQPPHRHVNEEFQYVISGSGTWHLNGHDIPLQKGDLMYAKPGDLHGIANTGTEPLRFFVVKWVSKGGEQAAP
jgi:mannose-6-phosphate isomerase-like protein (cupin superfamily)